MSEHEIRDLKYRLKQAHKQIGKQGEKIHLLRCEIAELLALTDPAERALMRAWTEGVERQELLGRLVEQKRTIENLREHIDRRKAAHTPMMTMTNDGCI